MSVPFQTAWVRPVRFGMLAAVPLPAGLDPLSEAVLAQLDPDERKAAVLARGRRQIEFAGGRLAAHAAAQALGVQCRPLGSGPEREPLPPPGITVSITHKNDLALALVARDADGRVGIDLEGDGRPRLAIASRVCRPDELTELEALPEAERWRAVLVRFAVKEAVYKAVYPLVRHFFGFQAARVELLPAPRVTLFLPAEDPQVAVEAELEWLSDDRVVALVRAWDSASRRSPSSSETTGA